MMLKYISIPGDMDVITYKTFNLYFNSINMKSASFQKLQIATLFFGMIFTACKKNPVNELTKTALITTSTWKFDVAGIDINGDGTSDSPLPPGVLPGCSTDNLINFKSDKSGTVDEGPTKCTATDPQTTPFNWEFANNETEINFTTAIFVGVGGAVKIIELTATKFVLSKNVDIAGIPVPVNVVVTLKH